VKSEVPRNARSVRSEWAEWDLTSESWLPPMRSTVEEYRPDGKLRFWEMRNPDGSICQTSNSYDDAGLLIESQFQSGDAPAGRTIYFHDGRGRLIRQVGRSPDGSERVTEEHVYAAGGEHTKILHFPTTGRVSDIYCPVEGVDFYFNAPGTTTMTTVLNGHERVSEVLLKDADGGVLRRVVLTRDESGRVVKDEVLLGAEPLMPDVPMLGSGAALATNEYTYDELGRRVGVVRRMFGLCEQRETTRYDDRGNRTQTTTEEQGREANMHEGNVEYRTAAMDRREARFEYKYDASGNWVERVTSQRHGDNPDFTPCSMERREIAYFDDSSARIG
jgi:hypothetical protein